MLCGQDFFFDVIFSIEDDVIEVNLIGRLLTHLDSLLNSPIGHFQNRMVEPVIDINNSGNTSSGCGIDVPTDGIASLLIGNDILTDGIAVGNTGIDSLDSGNDFPCSGIVIPHPGISIPDSGNELRCSRTIASCGLFEDSDYMRYHRKVTGVVY